MIFTCIYFHTGADQGVVVTGEMVLFVDVSKDLILKLVDVLVTPMMVEGRSANYAAIHVGIKSLSPFPPDLYTPP